MERKIWIIGNVIIGAGAILSFLYLLFGVFWHNTHLLPWYVGLIFFLFILFNFFAIKQHKVLNWLVALLIFLGSAGFAYLLHGLFLLMR